MRHVRGVLFADYIRMIRSQKDVPWRDALHPEDLPYLEEAIDAARWYPMESFERRDDDFVNLAGEWTFWRAGNPFGVRSWREQNAEATGLPIWRVRYQRR